jgi:hypothetical protein
MERLMPQPNDSGKSLVALDQDSTLVAVIEMGQASWLVEVDPERETAGAIF